MEMRAIGHKTQPGRSASDVHSTRSQCACGITQTFLTLLTGICLFLSLTSGICAQPPNWQPSPVAAEVQTILAGIDDETDFARVKLEFDRLVDPSIDIQAELARLDAMADDIRAQTPHGADDWIRYQILRRHIYEPGLWNDGEVFAYDHDDPLGAHIPSKLLPTYLDTRLGNCVSMPLFFILLGQRLDLNMTAATAPLHVFVRFTPRETGQTLNLEATSGAYPARDAWFQQNLPMTPVALENGVYMRSLNHEELAALMGVTLVEHMIEAEQYETAIETAAILLDVYPTHAYLHAKIGTAFYRLLERDFIGPYPDPAMVPPELLSYAQFLQANNARAFAQAEAMGWHPEGGLGSTQQ